MTHISICLPTYNGARYVQAALDSILTQSYTNFELIVSDDHSRDATAGIVAAVRDPRLRLFQNEQRLGLVGNWNRCLELATGEYVCIFHQDDVMQPHNIERQLAVLHDHPNVGLVFSNMVTIDGNGVVIGGHWTDVLPKLDTIFPGPAFFELLLDEGNVVPCSSVVARRSLFRDLGGFDPRLSFTPDLEMWLRLSLHCDVAYLAEPLVALRQHAGQESTHFAGKTREIEEVWRALRIVFTEQRSHIQEPDGMYDVAVGHMQDWLTFFIKSAVRSDNRRKAIDFIGWKIRFVLAQRRGLSAIRPVVARRLPSAQGKRRRRDQM